MNTIRMLWDRTTADPADRVCWLALADAMEEFGTDVHVGLAESIRSAVSEGRILWHPTDYEFRGFRD